MSTAADLRTELQLLASRLGPQVTLRRFCHEIGVAPSTISRCCGSWTQLRIAAGLPARIPRGRFLDDRQHLRQRLRKRGLKIAGSWLLTFSLGVVAASWHRSPSSPHNRYHRPPDDVLRLSMNTRHALLAGLCSFVLAAPTVAATPRFMVAIDWQGKKLTGTVVLHDRETGWFLERDGRLTMLPLAEVGDYQKLGSYRPYSAVELREQLSRDFGPGYTVSATGHYLIVSSRNSGDRYGRLFEDLYRQFVVSFAARGFKMTEPEFPLVAVVLPDQASFVKYCQAEDVRPQPGLRGYYLPSSNRVALYDAVAAGQATADGLDKTVIHEATHQVAFNTGVHSRIGVSPKWVVEGLATVFEQENVRRNDRIGPVMSRVNDERFKWFQQYRGRRPTKSLVDIVQSDRMFQSQTLDAYSEAWAIMFFLLETRPADTVKYLRALAARDPLKDCTPEDRLREFQTAFGNDLSLLEAHLLRYYDAVE